MFKEGQRVTEFKYFSSTSICKSFELYKEIDGMLAYEKANDISLTTDTRCYTFYSQVEYDNGWKFKSGLENIQIIYSKTALQYDDQYIVVDDEDINYNVKASDIILASPLI